MDKKVVMLGMVFGSTIGGYIPTMFGADSFSLSCVFWGFVGGLLGIWLTFKFLS